jgi:hypothetical protein
MLTSTERSGSVRESVYPDGGGKLMDRGDAVDLKLGAGVRVRQSYADTLKFKAVAEALAEKAIILKAVGRDDEAQEAYDDLNELSLIHVLEHGVNPEFHTAGHDGCGEDYTATGPNPTYHVGVAPVKKRHQKVKLPAPRNRAERRREQKKRGGFKGRRHR